MFLDQSAFRVDDSFQHVELGVLAGVVAFRIEGAHVVGEGPGCCGCGVESPESFRLLQEQQQHGGYVLAHAGIPAAGGGSRVVIIVDVAVRAAGAEIVVVVDVIVVVVIVEAAVFQTVVVVEGPVGTVAALRTAECRAGAVACQKQLVGEIKRGLHFVTAGG